MDLCPSPICLLLILEDFAEQVLHQLSLPMQLRARNVSTEAQLSLNDLLTNLAVQTTSNKCQFNELSFGLITCGKIGSYRFFLCEFYKKYHHNQNSKNTLS